MQQVNQLDSRPFHHITLALGGILLLSLLWANQAADPASSGWPDDEEESGANEDDHGRAGPWIESTTATESGASANGAEGSEPAAEPGAQPAAAAANVIKRLNAKHPGEPLTPWPVGARWVYQFERSAIPRAGRVDEQAAQRYRIFARVVRHERRDEQVVVVVEERGGPGSQLVRTVYYGFDKDCIYRLPAPGKKGQPRPRWCRTGTIHGITTLADSTVEGEFYETKKPKVNTMVAGGFGIVVTETQQGGRLLSHRLMGGDLGDGSGSFGRLDGEPVRCDWDVSLSVKAGRELSVKLPANRGTALVTLRAPDDFGESQLLLQTRKGASRQLAKLFLPPKRLKMWTTADGESTYIVAVFADELSASVQVLRFHSGGVEHTAFAIDLSTLSGNHGRFAVYMNQRDEQCTLQINWRYYGGSLVSNRDLNPLGLGPARGSLSVETVQPE